MTEDSTRDTLIAAARAAARNAHAPYSRFAVGAAVLLTDGRIVTGANFENASYGLTICAERNAVFQAVTAEGPDMRLRRVAVVCLGQQFPPCGACRQVIAEFSLPGGRTEVTFLQAGAPVTRTLAELLPASFAL